MRNFINAEPRNVEITFQGHYNGVNPFSVVPSKHVLSFSHDASDLKHLF